MSYRSLLARAFGFFRKQEPVDPSDSLCRFVLDSGKFNRQHVKAQAFLPAPNGLTSVFVTEDLSLAEAEELGWKFVAKPQNRSLRAMGIFQAEIAMNEELTVVRDDRSERHANIGGWPEEKAERMIIAKKIAAASQLRICSSNDAVIERF